MRAGFATRLVSLVVDFVATGSAAVAVILLFNGGIGWVLAALAPLAYYTWFEGGRSGQTPGKRLMAIRVVDLATGAGIGHGRAAVRSVMRLPSALLFGAGYVWMLWDAEGQTWHDKVAGSVVVAVDGG